MTATYENRSKAELLELAAERNIEGRSSMSKAELIAALRGGSEASEDDGSVDPHETSTDEQKEAAGAGRETAKDRADKKPAKPDNGPGFENDTPSAKALEKVGPDGDGEAYQAEKRKHRWG